MPAKLASTKKPLNGVISQIFGHGDFVLHVFTENTILQKVYVVTGWQIGMPTCPTMWSWTRIVAWRFCFTSFTNLVMSWILQGVHVVGELQIVAAIPKQILEAYFVMQPNPNKPWNIALCMYWNRRHCEKKILTMFFIRFHFQSAGIGQYTIHGAMAQSTNVCNVFALECCHGPNLYLTSFKL